MVVSTLEELVAAARHAVHQPDRLSRDRQQVAAAMFFEPGTATARAVALVRHMLDADGSACSVTSSTREPLGGGITP